jgi:hypothetical protein
MEKQETDNIGKRPIGEQNKQESQQSVAMMT